MLGCRPLSPEEVQAICDSFTGPWRLRNVALVTLGVNTGFRVSELLSIRLRDILEERTEGYNIKSHIYVQRKNMKGKKRGRNRKINSATKHILMEWVKVMRTRGLGLGDPFLFCRADRKALSYHRAWEIITTAAERLKLPGKVATHSWRKTFVHRIHQHYMQLSANGLHVDVLLETSAAAGHLDPKSTLSYLEPSAALQDNATDAVTIEVNV